MKKAEKYIFLTFLKDPRNRGISDDELTSIDNFKNFGRSFLSELHENFLSCNTDNIAKTYAETEVKALENIINQYDKIWGHLKGANEFKEIGILAKDHIIDNYLDLKPKIKQGEQLTINQCVLLLEEIGTFTGSISNFTTVDKAKLVSLLTGKNEKNIKSSIEKLNKKPSDLGSGHQKDIDKIKALLNSME